MIFDTHAHYNDEAFDADREELLAKMEPAGITRIVNMGATLNDVKESQELAGTYPFIYAGVGVHPEEVGALTEEKMSKLYDLCDREKTVAVGEIGLDYHQNKETQDLQKQWFIRQLKMANDVGLPVNIHSRDAAQDTFDIMKAEHAGTTGGIIHCFSSSAQMALDYVKLGYYIGIGGTVTFKNARTVKEVVSAVPLTSIVTETDCPYLAPTPHRGERNSSLYLPLVISAIAEIKGVSEQEVEKITYQNAMRVYHLN